MPRIELGLQAPHACVLPLYDIPFHKVLGYTAVLRYSARVKSPIGPPGIEPGLYAPEAYVLPVYYGPMWDTTSVLAYRSKFLLAGEVSGYILPRPNFFH